MKMSKTIITILCICFCGAMSVSAADLTKKAEDNHYNKIKVACLGDGITHGVGIENIEMSNYPSQLGKMLGEKYQVKDFGRPGSNLMRRGSDPYSKSPQFRNAIQWIPDIIVIHLGLNDLDNGLYTKYGDTFVTDYLSLVDSFKNVNPHVRVIVANLSPLAASHPHFKSGLKIWRDSIRSLTETVADIIGAELIDFGVTLRDRPNLLTDCLHPDESGAALLAATVRNVITGDFGGLALPPIYGDRMVLQRNIPLRIKGVADAGDTVRVSLGDKTAQAITNCTGEWNVTLPPFSESVALTMTITNGHQNIQFEDVAVGEVWLASGQSNMSFPLKETENFQKDTTIFEDPLLRLFNMRPSVEIELREWSEQEKKLVDELDYYKPTEWNNSTLSQAQDFSGIAWYYGKMLRDSLNVPVGIIHNAIGGSPIEAWIDIETLQNELPDILVDWRQNDFVQPWVRARGIQSTGMKDMSDPHRHPFEPSYLYATGIRPLAHFPIAGVIWYQGESNDHNIPLHEYLFPILISNWRKTWNQPQLPFLFAQLSSVVRPSWPAFRDSQRKMSGTLSDVAMAVTSDYGDSLDIHPKNKRVVGERLALQALNRVYSITHITPQGPTVIKAEMTAPGIVTLTFDYSKGLTTSDANPPRTFEVAEYKDLYFPADKVEILDDNTLRITSLKIKKPRFVRYGWQPVTDANLINDDGLPASTFKISVTEPYEN